MNMVIKKSLFKKIGCFDENMDYLEENEFFWRLFNKTNLKIKTKPKQQNKNIICYFKIKRIIITSYTTFKYKNYYYSNISKFNSCATFLESNAISYMK